VQIHLTKRAVISVVFALTLLFASIGVYAQVDSKTALLRFDKGIENGQFAELEQDLFRYVVANPNDAVGFSLLSKIRLKQERLNEAKSLAQKALALDQKLLSAKLILASAHYGLGEIEQANLILNRIADSELKDVPVRLNLAQLYFLFGDCQKSLKITEQLPAKIQNSEALSFRASCYLAANDKEKFAPLFATAKSLAKQNRIAAINFAEVLSKAAMHKETAELLRLVVVSPARKARELLLLAKSEVFLKDFKNVKIHLSQAEKLQPELGELLFVKALLESEQGNNAQSMEFLEKASSANPNSPEILVQFVIIAMRTNQSGKAVRAAERLFNMQPENLDALYLFGAASLQNNRVIQAEKALVKYFEARPGDSRGCVALGLAYAAQTDKLQEAREHMQRCISLNPNNYEAAYQLGLSYKTNGETAKAVEYLEDTIKLSPNYASALRDLGAAYLQIGAEVKARPVLEKAASLNPNDADTHFQLSRLYSVIGESVLAKKHLEIFQKLRNPKKEGM
jgi:tetratricopeptide (TPR) repeat protein